MNDTIYKRLTPFEASLLFIKNRNEQRLRDAHVGDIVVLDTLYANGVLKGFQHTVISEDRIHPLIRQHNIKRSKAYKDFTELELSSSDDEGF